MATPDPGAEWWTGLPVWAQAVGSVVFAVIMAALYKMGYKNPPAAKDVERSHEVQLVSGAFADRRSLQDLAMQIERLCDLIEQQLRERNEEAREQRLLDKMLDQLEKLDDRKRRE